MGGCGCKFMPSGGKKGGKGTGGDGRDSPSYEPNGPNGPSIPGTDPYAPTPANGFRPAPGNDDEEIVIHDEPEGAAESGKSGDPEMRSGRIQRSEAHPEVRSATGSYGRDPRGSHEKDPASSYGKDPSNSYGKDPAIAYVMDPASSSGKDPTSVYGHDPAISYGKDPTSMYGRDPTSSAKAATASRKVVRARREKPQKPTKGIYGTSAQVVDGAPEWVGGSVKLLRLGPYCEEVIHSEANRSAHENKMTVVSTRQVNSNINPNYGEVELFTEEDYQPGDYVFIRPVNTEQSVLNLAELYDLSEKDLDSYVTLSDSSGQNQLRNFRFPLPATLRHIFSEEIDLSGKPTAEFLKEIERSGSQKSPTSEESKTNVLELLKQVSKLPSIETLLSTAPLIQPRCYLAASATPGRLTIFYNLAKINSSRNGLCSEYLNGLKAGDHVTASIEPGDFVPPTADDSNGPVLMIAGYSGIAPFKGFLDANKRAPFSKKLYLLYEHRASTEPPYVRALQTFKEQGAVSDMLLVPVAGQVTEDAEGTALIDAVLSSDNWSHILKQLVTGEEFGQSIYVCGNENFCRNVRVALETIAERDLSDSWYFEEQLSDKGCVKLEHNRPHAEKQQTVVVPTTPVNMSKYASRYTNGSYNRTGGSINGPSTSEGSPHDSSASLSSDQRYKISSVVCLDNDGTAQMEGVGTRTNHPKEGCRVHEGSQQTEGSAQTRGNDSEVTLRREVNYSSSFSRQSEPAWSYSPATKRPIRGDSLHVETDVHIDYKLPKSSSSPRTPLQNSTLTRQPVTPRKKTAEPKLPIRVKTCGPFEPVAEEDHDGVILTSKLLSASRDEEIHEISLFMDAPYGFADIVEIRPQNAPRDIAEIINIYGIERPDWFFVLEYMDNRNKEAFPAITFRKIFTEELDLSCIPTFELLKALQQELASLPSELQKAASSEAAYNDWSAKTKPNLLTVLRMIDNDKAESSLLPSLELVISCCPRIKPRKYFITSITDGIITFNFRSIRIDNDRLGLATAHLLHMPPRGHLNAFVVRGTTLKVSMKTTRPLIFIASEFGITSLRNLWETRRKLKSVGRLVLLYEVKRAQTMLYWTEIITRKLEGVISDTLLTHSDDQPLDAELTYNYKWQKLLIQLMENQAHVFLSGPRPFCDQIRKRLGQVLGVTDIHGADWFHEDSSCYDIGTGKNV